MISFEDLFFVSQIKNYSSIKNEVLNKIDSMGKFSIMANWQRVSSTDWHLSRSYPRPYWDVLLPSVELHNKKFGNRFQYNYIEIINFWYQQYDKNDWHTWHTHPKINFSNVIYIEVSEKCLTKFRFMNQEFEIEVSEGSIMTFPGSMIHCSPQNLSNQRKTTITYNTSVELRSDDELEYQNTHN